MLSKIVQSLQIVPTLGFLVVGFYAFLESGQVSHLEYQIERLELKIFDLHFEDSEGNRIPEISIHVESEYSFQEFQPKHQLTIIDEGRVRLNLAYSNNVRLKLSAPGYQHKEIMIDKDSNNLNQVIILEPIARSGALQDSLS